MSEAWSDLPDDVGWPGGEWVEHVVLVQVEESDEEAW